MTKTASVKIADADVERYIQRNIEVIIRERQALKEAAKKVSKTYVEDLFQEVIANIAKEKASATTQSSSVVTHANVFKKPQKPKLTLSTLQTHHSMLDDSIPPSPKK